MDATHTTNGAKNMTTKIAHDTYLAKDFSVSVRRALLKRGIRIIGAQSIPGRDAQGRVDYANASTGYVLDDNGTGKIRGLFGVIALAGEEVPAWASIA